MKKINDEFQRENLIKWVQRQCLSGFIRKCEVSSRKKWNLFRRPYYNCFARRAKVTQRQDSSSQNSPEKRSFISELSKYDGFMVTPKAKLVHSNFDRILMRSSKFRLIDAHWSNLIINFPSTFKKPTIRKIGLTPQITWVKIFCEIIMETNRVFQKNTNYASKNV